ncbi:hypothetical protein SLS58_009493 [Diplodia intermedia]|uniref:Uncharacterized protein n=1 Tax=Diplodia intermedia TaxID=856260 RepID=A0ABR3TCE4_9PEZI
MGSSYYDYSSDETPASGTILYLTSLPGHFFASARMRDEVLSMLISRVIWRIDIYSADDLRDNMRRIRCTGDIAMTFVERAWVDILRPETGCWEPFPIDLKEDGLRLYQSDKPDWIWQRCGLLSRPRRIKLARLASEELKSLKRSNELTAELWAHTLQTLYELHDDDDDDDDELCDGGSKQSEN